MPNDQRGRQKPRSKTRDERAQYNEFAEDFLRFQVWVDACVGVHPSPERYPYNTFRRPAVERLLRRVDPEAPMVSTERRRRTSRGRTSAVTAATAQDFVADTVDDLWRC